MKKHFFLSIITGLCAWSVQCQTVQVDLKHFANKPYAFMLLQGDKNDTISTGKLDANGKTTLRIPPKYKSYNGMSHFVLTDGIGLDLIVGKENFTVRCADAQPNENNIEFTGSAENRFLIDQFLKQKKVTNKAEIAKAALQTYDKTDVIYQDFEKEQPLLNTQFSAIKNETAKSPLYAARFHEFIDYLTGTGSSLNQTPEQKQVYLAACARAKLDLDALYTSGQWSNVLGQWFETNLNTVKNDSILLDDAKYMASRIKDNKAYTAFAEKTVALMARAGKDDLLYSFGTFAAASKRIENPNSNLIRAMGGASIGMHAPELQLPNGKQIAIKPKTILFFYESGCNNCENEMLALRGNYQVLKEKGYEVVSVATDMDAATNEKTTSNFPWTQKYCDFKGHAGINFATYAVLGTPTIFVIDQQGNISGRYARLVDVNLLN
jgi:peroxiredoxin